MRLGVVVDSRQGVRFEHLKALGASAISVKIRPGRNQKAFLRAAHADHGLAVLGVLDRESFRARLDWRGSADADLLHIMSLVEGGFLDALAIGYEPDDGFTGASDDPLVVPRGGVGSWVLPFAELAELILMLRIQMREVPLPIPLVLGGLCSWRTDVLDTLDLALLDGILIHPYGAGRQPEATIGAYLDGLAGVLAARGLTERVKLGIGELGLSDQAAERGEIADWFSRTLAYLAGRDDVDACFICCDSDLTLDGYGQFDAKGRAKPSVASIFGVGQRLPTTTLLFSVPPTNLPEEASTEPAAPPEWDDPYFTPEQIAQAMAQADGHVGASALIEPLRALWPEFTPYLTQFELPDDPAPRIALLAALYVATAGRLTPITEGGAYLRAEHRYGDKRGNLYHGDGWHYRGRGLIRLLGRAAYTEFGQALDLPLVDEPDLVLEPAIAAGVAALTFQQQGLFTAALRGDWVDVWRGVDPALHGYGTFLAVAQGLVDVMETAPDPAASMLGPAALGVALTRFGDPYTPGGDRPGGFDGRGLVTWAYTQVIQESLPPTLESLAESTQTLGADQTQPGDLVLYEYGDPATGGSQYDHVALLVDQELVLDARVGSGVGYRPHVRGAIRRYRRVTGPGRLTVLEEGEMAWQAEKARLAERFDHLATQLTTLRTEITERPEIPEQPTEKASKAEWLEWGRRIHRWRTRNDEEFARHTVKLVQFEHELRSLLDQDRSQVDAESETEGAADGQDE